LKQISLSYIFNNLKIYINMDSYNKVIDTLKVESKALSAGQIAELTGIERKEVDKVMKKLKTEGKITSPKNCYWQLK
jgi:biotin operon repressor